MYIEEIILDGFKSYAQRTVIKGFDPQFNAITGLNGSGKSNILDSICFVLGISNLSQVRASNLQDLVYKQGQAGITKASVSIIFNNLDKSKSPVGYTQYDEITVTRQVIIGGKNKYLINGHVVPASRIPNLFHSVQLNVNNPHFLIMQGRITKVLNNKPMENLAMLEETAGTRMYETKKVSALQVIEKKDRKLDEIERVLAEDVTPMLNKLRGDRTAYLEFQKTEMEMDKLNRLCVASDYSCAERVLAKQANDLETKRARIAELRQQAKKEASMADEADDRAASAETFKAMMSGAELKEAESRVAALSKELVKANAALTHQSESVTSESKNIKTLRSSLLDTENSILVKEAEEKQIHATVDVVTQKDDTVQAELEQLNRQYQAMSTGMSEEGQASSFAEQIMAAEQRASTILTEQKQAELRAKHATAELKKLRPAAAKAEQQFSSVKTALKKSEAAVARATAALEAINYSQGTVEVLTEDRNKCVAAVEKASSHVDTLSSQLTSLEFSYRDPERNWDRTRVKGLVAELINVADGRNNYAIEVTAGARLYNVVVDSAETGKKLLSKGALKKRVTIIPLDKISSRSLLSAKKVAAAKRLVGSTNVNSALSLVGYDSEIESAMEFIFGSTFVCATSDAARCVAFNNETRARCTTIDGDIFDPSGTLTGGARPSSGPAALAALGKLRDARSTLVAAEENLFNITSRLTEASALEASNAKLKRELDCRTHEHTLLLQRTQDSAHFKLFEQIETLETTIETANSEIAAFEIRVNETRDEVANLQKEMDNFSAHREKELGIMEKRIKSMKKSAAESGEEANAARQKVSAVQLEMEQLRSELSLITEQIKEGEASLSSVIALEETMREDVKAKKEAYGQAEEALQIRRGKILEHDSEIADERELARSLRENIAEAELEAKRLEGGLARANKEKEHALATVEKLSAEHEWIAGEKVFFGQPNTTFDFEINKPDECKARLLQLQEKQKKLKATINTKVMNMFQKAESEYNELLKKKRIVENDKAKIQNAIEALDTKKNAALLKVFEQVNKDFGSIFSTLLPGTDARLSPVEGHSVLEGIEVKVAFGNKWKESLLELSGGQRSLVALSLVLSLLLFKPAPMYILDEVDAALDLSHTQNIGHMLKTHFSQSQFIVVSLKDGMFNNANVLFKTKFVDGLSTVTRLTSEQRDITSSNSKKNTKSNGGRRAPSAITSS